MTDSGDCPYDFIEKGDDIVQIICIYSNNDKYDYPINDLTPCGNSAEVVCKDFV